MNFASYAEALEGLWRSRPAALVLHRVLPSTHTLARRISEEYSAEGSNAPPADLLAWQQTGGRGRFERPWTSPAGAGVYASLVRTIPGASLQALPLLVAVALCETVNARLDNRCRLKWPNDLFVERRKLGGILIDAVSRGEDEVLVVISFGVNRGEIGSEPRATWILRETDDAPDLVALTAELVAAVDRALAADPAGIGERFCELSLHEPGDQLRVRVDKTEIEGRFVGIDGQGFLRLDVDGEERLLAAGEVEV